MVINGAHVTMAMSVLIVRKGPQRWVNTLVLFFSSWRRCKKWDKKTLEKKKWLTLHTLWQYRLWSFKSGDGVLVILIMTYFFKEYVLMENFFIDVYLSLLEFTCVLIYQFWKWTQILLASYHYILVNKSAHFCAKAYI